ncbi:hypothetical protein VB712_02240 [Spirulina sp. CCNP1310]|uniref:hypothetical protein n=1 Tax=Spirulina sp. CCNP1310 TaxID=3110249 RepID=UPI002B1F0236|nr:hypothetical protein [Spirulina sp. CCNP1310]MEA5418025.1 hypothetical protein [Spirulina sp. CCNP1310]
MSIQYITNENGQRVGVMLDLATYEQLTHPLTNDPECLLNISPAELQAFANIELALNSQQTLNTLLSKNNQSSLTPTETQILDELLEQIDALALLKARAKYTLQRRQELEIMP